MTQMLYVHGSFTSLAADNFAHTGGGWELVRNENGGVQSLVKRIACEFWLTGDDPVVLNARFRQIREALSRDGVDSGFLLPNGTESEVFIRNSETIGGVLVFAPPFPVPDTAGSNFATGLKGTFTVAAEFTKEQVGFGGLPDGSTLSSFTESFSTRGNGRERTTIVEYDKGQPEKYVLADQTKVTASQQGSAVITGVAHQYPGPTAPMYPEDLLNPDEAVTYSISEAGNGKWANRVDWDYQYERVGTFSGETRPIARKN